MLEIRRRHVRKYCKVHKFWDARNFCCNYLEFKQKVAKFKWVLCQNGGNGIANSEDPDQTTPAPQEAV